MGRNTIDLMGKKFGRLTVIEYIGIKKWEQAFWRCLCICGKTIETSGSTLRRGQVKSCGCLQKEWGRIAGKYYHSIKHGDSKKGKISKLYYVWLSMKQRCLNIRDSSYKYYGAKGISLYKKWKNDYFNFKSWAISNGYKSGLSIDRINNKLGYSPKNCQWLTISENVKKRWEGRDD